jgi:hypothetical protein
MPPSDPRPVITGVTPPPPLPAREGWNGVAGAAGAAREDWYQATIDGADHDQVARSIALGHRAELVPARALYGYGAALSVEAGDRVLATVFGRSSRDGEVHVQTSGDACDLVVPTIRRLWPAHRVSRVDSAIDFLGNFPELDARAVAFAEDRGLRYRLVTDSQGGATRYLGSPSSEVSVRVYKKSEQLLQLHPDQADEIPAGVVRAECQVRPGKRATKELAARSSAEDVWGFAEWSAHFAASILDLEPVREPTHFRRSSDWTRALHYLGRQYGPAAERRAEQIGRASAAAEVLRALGLS